MITSSIGILTKIKQALDVAVSPVKVYSVIPPDPASRYIYLEQLSENFINEKRAFLGQGFVSITLVEKFVGRGGSVDWVESEAETVSNLITPSRLSTFGDIGNINIFTMQIEAGNSQLLSNDNGTGRTALKSLRLEYKFKSI